MIHVIATIEVKSARQDEFLGIFKANIPAVQAEPGCIRYDPTVDLASGLPPQIPLRQNAVTIVETWESLEALRTHLAAAHMAAYKAATKDMVEKVTLQVLQPV